jgi:hypothetical protein
MRCILQAFKQLDKDGSGVPSPLSAGFHPVTKLILCCLWCPVGLQAAGHRQQRHHQIHQHVIFCSYADPPASVVFRHLLFVLQAFKQLDKDGSGTITIEELSEALRVFGIYDDAKELLASADTNGDGLIDYAEFSWLLRNHNEALRVSGRAEAKGQLARFF